MLLVRLLLSLLVLHFQFLARSLGALQLLVPSRQLALQSHQLLVQPADLLHTHALGIPEATLLQTELLPHIRQARLAGSLILVQGLQPQSHCIDVRVFHLTQLVDVFELHIGSFDFFALQ